MLGTITIASYAGTSVAVANSAGLVVQAELYHKSPLDISYSVRDGQFQCDFLAPGYLPMP